VWRALEILLTAQLEGVLSAECNDSSKVFKEYEEDTLHIFPRRDLIEAVNRIERKYVDKEELEHRIRRWAELEEEARRIRREMADWEFIEKQEPRIKEALKYYIEKGDIRRASMLAGVDLEAFRDLLRKARIPVIV
jgi:hypothetical protein